MVFRVGGRERVVDDDALITATSPDGACPWKEPGLGSQPDHACQVRS